MKFKSLTFLLIILLLAPIFVNSILAVHAQPSAASAPLYLGVDAAFLDVPQTEQLIDNISAYTNFFIIGCEQQIGQNGGFGVYNETRLTVVGNYAYAKGLSFIAYSDDPTYPSKQWLSNATQNYGAKFMGIYYFDEPGGKQIDQVKYPPVTQAQNFTDAADKYSGMLNLFLRTSTFAIARSFPDPSNARLFTSDYGLYWYDYAGGYSTVFAELGINSGDMNYSRQLSIALCRGAATAFNQDWGVMITYGSTNPPYMEDSSELYTDMLWAYENGAKYIIVFDSNPNFTQSILTTAQENAIKSFWQYAQQHPRSANQLGARSAYVLPPDFAYSFRSPNDTVWGLWNSNWNGTTSLNFVADVSMCVVTYLQMFGPELDVMYPSINGTAISMAHLASLGYQHVIYWNDTALVPNMPPMPPANPAISSYKTPNTTPFNNGDTRHTQAAAKLEFYVAITAAVLLVLVALLFVGFRRRRSSGCKAQILPET